jgi:hypothetical protein
MLSEFSLLSTVLIDKTPRILALILMVPPKQCALCHAHHQTTAPQWRTIFPVLAAMVV